MQDYGRAVIIGEPSFGKGTVQTIINLDQLANNDKQKFGELKMTIAQFFRINGGTTQLRGVTPDISLPSISDAESFGESSFDNALPWIKIDAAEFQPVGNLTDLFPLLQVRHDTRVAKNMDFQYLLDDIAEFKAHRKTNMISLNLAERRKEKLSREAREKLRDKNSGSNSAIGRHEAMKDDGLQAGERSLSAELAAEKAQKKAKDVLLDEAVHILSDEIDLLKTDSKLAASVLPPTP
jgi:carboxyl-terminal processing protease